MKMNEYKNIISLHSLKLQKSLIFIFLSDKNNDISDTNKSVTS